MRNCSGSSRGSQSEAIRRPERNSARAWKPVPRRWKRACPGRASQSRNCDTWHRPARPRWSPAPPRSWTHRRTSFGPSSTWPSTAFRGQQSGGNHFRFMVLVFLKVVTVRKQHMWRTNIERWWTPERGGVAAQSCPHAPGRRGRMPGRTAGLEERTSNPSQMGQNPST